MQIGKVRAARKGEVPTHYATESIKEGAGVVAKAEKVPEEYGIYINFDTMTREERMNNLRAIGFRARQHILIEQDKERSRNRWLWALIIAMVVLIGWALTAQAATITVTTTAQKPLVNQDTQVNVAQPQHGASSAQKGVQEMATITAYSSSVDETDDTPEVMASGRKVYAGAVACPQRLSFGTKVNIEGQQYTCEDRMAPKYGERFDIWQPSKQAAITYGVHRAAVEVVVE